MERSPQLRERSEIIHHCSRQSGAARSSSSGSARSRSAPRSRLLRSPLRPSFSSSLPFLLCSALRSSALLLSLSSPLPTLFSLSPLSPSRPDRLARCRTDSPSLVQLSVITRKISPGVSARVFSSLCRQEEKKKKKKRLGPPCSLHRVSISCPFASRLPFSRVTCTGLFLNEKKRDSQDLHPCKHFFSPPGENGVIYMNHNKIASKQFLSRSLSGTQRSAPPSS